MNYLKSINISLNIRKMRIKEKENSWPFYFEQIDFGHF
jgi:hypothetical protein